jgi:hypothetical protein
MNFTGKISGFHAKTKKKYSHEICTWDFFAVV